MRFEYFALAAAANVVVAQRGGGRGGGGGGRGGGGPGRGGGPPPWVNRPQQPVTRPPQQPQPTPRPPPAGATQSVWGQCGGRTYTGATACPRGNYCRFDGNEWYQQCVPDDYESRPGANPGGGNQGGGGGGGVFTRTITTVFSFDDPLPTRVTTYITVLQPVTVPPQPQPVPTYVPDVPIRPPGE